MAHSPKIETSREDELSVYGLITRLSEILVKDDCPSLSVKQQKYSVSKARSVLYGTILGKYHVNDISKLSERCNCMSPLAWLIAQKFVLSNTDKEVESLHLDDAIQEAFSMGWDKTPLPVLQTLILLSNSSCLTGINRGSYEPFHLVENLGLANIHKVSSKSVPRCRMYPSLTPELFRPPPWMSVKHSMSLMGGYVTSFPFNLRPGEGLPLLQMFGERLTDRPKSRSIYQLRTIPSLSGPRDLTETSTWSHSNYEDEGYFTPMTEVANQSHITSDCDFEDPTRIWSEALQGSLPQLKSWESFGSIAAEVEPPFFCCAGDEAIHHLSNFGRLFDDILNTHYTCDSKATPRKDFVRDVFFLLIGVESTSFPFLEENDRFVVRKGMWLEGYDVDDTATLSQDFLFCGTHFKQLERLSHSTKALDEGLMMNSLMDCIQRWAQFYRGAVLILSSHFLGQGSSILFYELLEYIKALKEQIDCLSMLTSVNASGQGTSLPSGIGLLAHIYREACKSNNHQQSHLLYSALKSCCEVYLQCLQKWIFLGDCSDEKKSDFFVKRDSMYSSRRDRSFWLWGFVLDKNSVPVFLQGLEVAVFDCGRAMNLLQLCKPQHPLCVLLEKKHPTIHCCLYKTDMEKVQKECVQFEEEAEKVCGSFMNVSMMLEEDNEREAELHIMVQRAHKEREIARASLKIKEEKEKAEMKEKQNAALKAQILEIQQRKSAEKEQQRIDDEQYLLECQRLENAAKFMEEEERKRVLAHYEELGKIVDKQNRHREWQIKRLKMADKRNTFLHEDSLNLAREFQLLEKKNRFAPISMLEPPNVSLSVHSKQDDAISSSNVGEDSLESVPSPVIDSSRSVPDGVIVNEMQSTADIFKEAQDIQDRKLEIEFSLDSEMLALNDKADLAKTGSDNLSKLNNSTYTTGKLEKIDVKQVAGVCNDAEFTSRPGVTGTIEGLDKHEPSPLVKNRLRVMTESSEASTSRFFKKTSEDSGIISDLERNRQKVLSGEYDILTGVKKSNSVNVSDIFPAEGKHLNKSVPVLSDLEKNRRVFLREEFNTLTGETTPKHSDSLVSIVVTFSDSGVEGLSSKTDSFGSQSCQFPERKQTISFQKKDTKCNPSECPRPEILSLSSDISSISPITTPLGFVNMPVFTSPFKGTNCLPHELPLASPLQDLGNESNTVFEVNGIPLMVDIADNFAVQFCSESLTDFDTVDLKYDSENSKTLPNTSWLESSLQTCLLLPLRMQYKYVSAALLHFFLVDLKLLSHLKSLRSYFLMQDGEFGRHLTVKLFTRMYQVSTPDKLLNGFTLDKIVREALAGSQSTTDPNQDRIALTASSVPDHFSHSSPNVLDCLQLTYNVKWPLNLMLTPDVLEKYNVIFVFLVRLKRVAWLLQEDFVALKNTARGCFKEQNRDLLNSPQYHQVQMIRHSMSQFVQATLNYISSSVLHASWTDFATSLKQATTIDHIYNAHIEYIKRLLKRCLLNNNSKRVEAVLSKILVCIIKFHGNLRVRPWQVPNKHQGLTMPSVYLEHPNFQQLVAFSVHFKLQVSKFVSYLERLISPPNQQQHLAEYLLLLNINGFFKSSDYLKHAETVRNTDGKSVTSSQSSSKEQLRA